MYNQTILMHVSDAGSILGCSSQTIYKLINNDEIKSFKAGRVWKISVQSVKDYANSKLNN
ncbi:MAG: Helix-turn-helix domain [Firmicutes bacterium]|nr:Helix-turn-helix domain [Bacillota bacterium]